MVRRAPHRPSTATAAPQNAWRGWLLLCLTALCVARPLLPSESEASVGQADGAPFVMLLGLVLVVWLGLCWLYRSPGVRWGWADAAWVALAASLAASGVWGMYHGTPRSVLNALWEWLALGAGFFLARQLIATPREARAVVAVFIALAVAIAALGWHQYLLTMPETLAHFQKDPVGLLRESGVNIEPGTPEWQLYKNRLESTEPTATFALANSLAGFLAPWFIVVLGVAATSSQRWLARLCSLGRPNPAHESGTAVEILTPLVLLAGALVMAGCLVLTKSRSAWLAVALGTAAVGWLVRPRGKVLLATVGIGLLAICGLAAAAVKLGALDWQVLTEAPKSLGYRWQYWRASLGMVADYPWLGCGPGNFQDYYTRYKLPEASEVIADPHNFVIEIWATAGTLGLLALLAVMAASGAELLAGRARRGESAAATSEQPHVPAGDAWKVVLAGGAVGFCLAYSLGPLSTVSLTSQQLIFGMLPAALVCWGLYPWVLRGTLPAALPLLGALVLLVNLLAAGGLSYPGVAGSLWLLLAVATSAAADHRAPQAARALAPRRELPAAAMVLAFVAALAIEAACYKTSFQPVMACRAEMSQALRDRSHAEAHLLAAAAADRWSAAPWEQLEQLQFARWMARHERPDFAVWQRYTREMLGRRALSRAAWSHVGDAYLTAFLEERRPDDLQEAISAYHKAVRLYPNHALTRGQLASSLFMAGLVDEARRQAERALDLDELTPHADQKLPSELREKLREATQHRKRASF